VGYSPYGGMRDTLLLTQ